jgi:hypothetical protein
MTGKNKIQTVGTLYGEKVYKAQSGKDYKVGNLYLEDGKTIRVRDKIKNANGNDMIYYTPYGGYSSDVRTKTIYTGNNR